MDCLVISQCTQIYDQILSSKLGKFIVRKFKEMPSDSIYFKLFNDCRNSLKTENFKNVDSWLDYVQSRFSEVRRALDPKNDISLGLETIYQLLEEEIKTRSIGSEFNLSEEIEKANAKIHELLPLFPDNFDEFNDFLSKEEPKYHSDFVPPEPRPTPKFTTTELDVLVAKLRGLKTDKEVADVMDILQHYNVAICQDSDDEINVNFSTLDPFTTEKVKQYTDSLE